MKIIIAYLLILISYSSSLFALNVTKVEFIDSKDVEFQNIESEIISELANKSLFEDKKKGIQQFSKPSSFRKIIPDGSYQGPISPRCWFSEFEKKALILGSSGQAYSQLVNDYFKACGDELSKYSTFSLLGLYEFTKTHYDFPQNSQINKIQISFDNGRVLTGFVGVKDLKIPRPWLIVKCGVFCSAAPSPSNKNFMIHLFDQTPFNIIFLANRTGYEYISMNGRLTVAGLLESQDLYSVAHWLKKISPYAHTVSSMHAVGISLGGASIFYADQVVPSLSDEQKQIKFNSMTAICPVVNLSPTIHDIFSGIKGMLFSSKTWELLRSLRPYLTELKDILDRDEEPSQEEFPSIILTSTSRYASKEKLAFGKLPEIRTEKDVAKYNQYSEFTNGVHTPFFVWASKDDIIVDNDINSRQLLRSIQAKKFNNMGVVNVPYGNHCAFATAYGFPTASSIIRTFILNHSPEFMSHRREEIYNLEDVKINMKAKEIIVNYYWSAKPGDRYFRIHIEVANPALMEICQALTPVEIHRGCRDITDIRLPLDLLEKMGQKRPATPAEYESLTRWLNSQVIVVNQKGESVVGTSSQPVAIKWSSFNFDQQ